MMTKSWFRGSSPHKPNCGDVPQVILQLFPQVGKYHHDNTIPFRQVFFTQQTVEVPITSVVKLCWLFSKAEADELDNTLGHGSQHVYVVTLFGDGREYRQKTRNIHFYLFQTCQRNIRFVIVHTLSPFFLTFNVLLMKPTKY